MRLSRYELIVNANVCSLVGANVLDGSGRFFCGNKIQRAPTEANFFLVGAFANWQDVRVFAVLSR